LVPPEDSGALSGNLRESARFFVLGVIFVKNNTHKNRQTRISVVVNFINKENNEHLIKAAGFLAKGAVNSTVENRIGKNV